MSIILHLFKNLLTLRVKVNITAENMKHDIESENYSIKTDDCLGVRLIFIPFKINCNIYHYLEDAIYNLASTQQSNK